MARRSDLSREAVDGDNLSEPSRGRSSEVSGDKEIKSIVLREWRSPRWSHVSKEDGSKTIENIFLILQVLGWKSSFYPLSQVLSRLASS